MCFFSDIATVFSKWIPVSPIMQSVAEKSRLLCNVMKESRKYCRIRGRWCSGGVTTKGSSWAGVRRGRWGVGRDFALGRLSRRARRDYALERGLWGVTTEDTEGTEGEQRGAVARR